MSTFETKASARSAVRQMVRTYGAAAVLAALDTAITTAPKTALNAYGRGRRTLVQQPWIHCRDAVREVRAKVTDRVARRDAPELKAEDLKSLQAVVNEYDAPVVLNFVHQIWDEVNVNKHIKACDAAMERHAERRAKFACPAEQRLGIQTLAPEPKKAEEKAAG